MVVVCLLTGKSSAPIFALIEGVPEEHRRALVAYVVAEATRFKKAALVGELAAVQARL